MDQATGPLPEKPREAGVTMGSELTIACRDTGVATKTHTKAMQTRDVILAAAAKLFRDEGYTATTLRQIAKFADIEAGSIYYHFPSKEAIVCEVLQIGVRDVFEAVLRVKERIRQSETGFRRGFELMIGAHLGSIMKGSEFASANIRNFSRLPEDLRAVHRPLRRRYAGLWDELLEEGRVNGDVRPDIDLMLLRQFVLSALNWTVEWHDVDRYHVEVLSEGLSRLLLDGMAAQGTDISDEPAPILIKFAEIADLAGDDGTKASRTRAHLLSVAARVLRERGYKATTMRDIAEAANIKAGSIYYHFASKDEIVDAVLDIGLRHLLREISEVVANETAIRGYRTRIAAAIRIHLEYLFHLSDFVSANIRIYGQLPSAIRARHRPLRRAYAQVWDKFLQEAQAAGVIRPDIRIVPLRQAMLGALNWSVEWFDPGKQGSKGDQSLAELIAMVQTLLLDGLQSPDLRAAQIALGSP